MAEIFHFGTERHSGRYPWGSGKSGDARGFLNYISSMRKEGLSDNDIAASLGMNSSEFRNKRTIARAEAKADEYATIVKLKDKGYSQVAIGKKIGRTESYVRSVLNPVLKERSEELHKVADILRSVVDEKKYVDVGLGSEYHLGVSRTKLKAVLQILKDEGYNVYNEIRIPQLGTDKKTTYEVLADKGLELADVVRNRYNISTISPNYFSSPEAMKRGLLPVESVDSKRLSIKYAEDGGTDRDGLIEIRRGVEGLSLGRSSYAQVRIAVDGTHFIKGMAVYSDNIPDGKDIVFNTNKNRKDNILDALKPMQKDIYGNVDMSNPFGSGIRQNTYISKDGTEKLSKLNIVYEEGDWSNWSKTLSTQFLAKQRPSLAKQQLDLMYQEQLQEYESISLVNNPVVRKKLLFAFSDQLDKDGVHLEGAALPRQSWSVILPFPSIKENEVYAPNYRDGEPVVLIRYPHGGRFEIAEVTVNNKNPEALSAIKNAKDAIGIHPKTAQKLSGADFDGDTVIVIPNSSGVVKTDPHIIDFNPKESYPHYEGMHRMTPKEKGLEMGKVSNLITDMTIRGASFDEIARAVKHSMVVIDAEKHYLDYKRSAIDHGIPALRAKYQGGPTRGASTLISKSTSDVRVDHRKEHTNDIRGIDPNTGEKIYRYTGETYTTKEGKIVKRQTLSKALAETSDAHELSSGTRIESIYADHSNKLKALANSVRKEALSIGPLTYSPSARIHYKDEVASLNAKLDIALRNKPLERQAQLLGGANLKEYRLANPDLVKDKDKLKKVRAVMLQNARNTVQAKKETIVISDKEWSAIQAGAVSNSLLSRIIENSDLDRLRILATPREQFKTMSTYKLSRAKNLLSAGYTRSEVADALGVSVSTLDKSINPE